MRTRTWLSLACIVLAVATAAAAEVRLANIFNDHMVLQRDKPVTVWGWADAGATVTVMLTSSRAEAVALAGEKALAREAPPAPVTDEKPYRARITYAEENAPAFTTVRKTATADDAGLWTVTIDPLCASFAPKFLAAAAGGQGAAVGDVLVGEVWLCAGQSNMFYSGNTTGWLDNKGLLAGGVRYAHTGRANYFRPRADLAERATWRVCVEANTRGIPTIPYLFGKFLHRQLGVPVGVINAASGGAQGNYWCSLDELNKIDYPAIKDMMTAQNAAIAAWDDPAGRKRVLEAYEAEYAAALAEWQKQADAAKAAGKREPKGKPEHRPPTRPKFKSLGSFLYNARIVPAGRMAIRGFLYLQGEQQVLTWAIPQYAHTFPAVIRSFRAAFGDETLPFGIISLQGASHTKGNRPELDSVDRASIIREMHYYTHLATPHTGFICAHDVGLGLHPNYKRPVAERAVFWAMRDVYKAVEDNHMSLKKVTFGNGVAQVHLQRVATIRKRNRKTGKTEVTYENRPARFAAWSSSDTFPMSGFVIADADRRWYPAAIRIVKEPAGVLEVYSDLVPEPAAVRYGWGNYPHANLGDWHDPLPPFRTDNWPLVCGVKHKIPEGSTPRTEWYKAVGARYDDQLDRQIRQGAIDAAIAELKLHSSAAGIVKSKADRISAILDQLEPGFIRDNWLQRIDRVNWLNRREDESRLRAAANVPAEMDEMLKKAEIRKQVEIIRRAAAKLKSLAD